MSSQQQLEQSQQALVAVIKAATVSVNAIGTVEVQAALDGLKKATEGAERRLKHAADIVRGTFGALSRSGNEIARQLATDVFAFQHRAAPAPEQTPAPVELPESAVVEDAPPQPTDEEIATIAAEIDAWRTGHGIEETTRTVTLPKEVQPVAGATTAGNGKRRRR